MLQFFRFLVVAISCTQFSVAVAAADEGDGKQPSEPTLTESIVRFRSNINRDKAEYIISDSGFEVVKTIPQLNMYVVKPIMKSSDSDKLKKSFGVMYVEPNGLITMDEVPNDKKYKSQWHHRNIKSEIAWETTTGSADVIVAVIDTGVSLKHEDLKNQIWTNKNEIPGNKIDDDHNGYIDDVNGWDFINHDNNPHDDQSHGTHCAGIIGAEGNNGIGTTGIAWNVKIMPLKFLSASGSGSEDDAVIATVYAADNGARIISASWGSTETSQSLQDSVQYAAERGVLFVAAAGNSTENNDSRSGGHYPSNFDVPNVISVGSSTTSSGKSNFSNFGRTKVHVAAPGSSILSTNRGEKSYAVKSGTSMATPVVAGLAAMILSLDPGMDVQALKNAVLNAVEGSKAWKEKNATGGIVRADKAVAQIYAGPQIWPGRIRIKEGKTYPMTAYGVTQAHWSTSDANVVTVSANGVIEGVVEGKAQVRIQKGSETISAEIEIVK